MNVKLIIAVVVALLLGLLYFSASQPTSGPQPTLAVALGGADQIALVNPASGKLVKIDVGSVTHGVGVLPNGRKAYAASRSSDEVSVLDLSQRKVIKRINVGGRSHHIAVSPNGRWVYVTVDSNNTVAVIDTSTDVLTTTIPVGAGPTYTVFAPDGSQAYVSSKKAGIISVIDTAQMKVIKKITAGKQPDHLAFTPDGRTLYVTNRGSNDVSAIDTQSDQVVATIPVGKGPHGIAVVERQGRLLVAVGNLAETSLSLIDAATNRVIQTIDLGTNPMHLTASPNRNYLYIGSVPTKQLLVYDVERGRVVKRIDLGEKVQPHQIAVVGKPAMGGSEAVQARSGSYRNIDAKQLRAMMQDKAFLLINVHIPYAGELPQTDLFIPFNKIEQNLAQLPKDKSAKIVVYCRSGRMSAIAAQTLVKLGYTNVWNLKQGMRGWQQAGYPLLDKSRGAAK